MHNVSLNTFEVNEFDVAQRKPLQDSEVKQYLDSQIENILGNRGVDHPFLNSYGSRKLSKEQEKILYLETYYYFRHVPFYICSICTLTRDENIMREVLANVRDELGTSKSHSELFLEFLESIGITKQEILEYTPLESTQALNQGIFEIYTTPPLLRAMGALYAEETQSAAMVSKYNAGLENQGYDRELRHFWLLHIEAEVGHSNSVFNCIHGYLKDSASRALFEQGILDYMKLLEGYWDGVQRRIDAVEPSN